MAFTEQEKTLIREYLGWSARFGQTDSALENAIAAIEVSDANIARARDHLTELQRIDAAIVKCESRFKASKVGSIELNAGELGQLRSRGSERVGRLATLFAVEVRDNPFSPAGPRWRGSFTGPVGGGNSQMQG